MEETEDESWRDFPIFAPEKSALPRIDQDEPLSEEVPSSIAALSHLVYDDETPQERAELLRDKGNMMFKRGPK